VATGKKREVNEEGDCKVQVKVTQAGLNKYPPWGQHYRQILRTITLNEKKRGRKRQRHLRWVLLSQIVVAFVLRKFKSESVVRRTTKYITPDGGAKPKERWVKNIGGEGGGDLSQPCRKHGVAKAAPVTRAA